MYLIHFIWNEKRFPDYFMNNFFVCYLLIIFGHYCYAESMFLATSMIDFFEFLSHREILKILTESHL